MMKILSLVSLNTLIGTNALYIMIILNGYGIRLWTNVIGYGRAAITPSVNRQMFKQLMYALQLN